MQTPIVTAKIWPHRKSVSSDDTIRWELPFAPARVDPSRRDSLVDFKCVLVYEYEQPNGTATTSYVELPVEFYDPEAAQRYSIELASDRDDVVLLRGMSRLYPSVHVRVTYMPDLLDIPRRSGFQL